MFEVHIKLILRVFQLETRVLREHEKIMNPVNFIIMNYLKKKIKCAFQLLL